MRIEVTMKYVQRWEDHLGRRRYRFRRAGYPRVELPVDADPSSPEFQAAYHAAMKGEKPAEAMAAVTARGGSGTVKNAIEQYVSSTTFHEYDTSTRSRRCSLLNSVSRMVGSLPIAQMDRNWIERWLEMSSTKGVQKTRLLAVKPFFRWALKMHLITADPTDGIKVKIEEGAGHATWTDEEIEQYRAHHPLGTMARLALE
jgi:integrase/recombinase XerD